MVILQIFHYLLLLGMKGSLSKCNGFLRYLNISLNTHFVTLDQIVHKLWLSPPILPIFTTFEGKGWLKIDKKKLLLAIKGRSPNFRSVFNFFPMLDTHLMNLGQIAHKLWLLPYFTLFITLAKNYYK